MVMAAEKSTKKPRDREKTYLSADDVARQLDVTVDTVRRWLRNGDLVGMLISRQAGYRIERAELERFIRSRRPE